MRGVVVVWNMGDIIGLCTLAMLALMVGLLLLWDWAETKWRVFRNKGRMKADRIAKELIP